jgi:ankyrin repeat protein
MNSDLLQLCDISHYNPIGLNIGSFIDHTILLKYAIKENNYIVCKIILDEIKELTNNLIFSYAVENNNDKIIHLILDYIYDYNILDEKDQFNDTPLNKAAFNGNLNLCKYLVYNNVNILGYKENENLNKKLNSTPLYSATQSNNYQLVKFLLKNGADPNIWSFTGFGNVGELPLHVAILNNNYKIAKLLILYGANPNEELNTYYPKFGVDIKHYSPLYIAINTNKIKFLKLFKYYCNSITHKDYLELRNKFRKLHLLS